MFSVKNILWKLSCILLQTRMTFSEAHTIIKAQLEINQIQLHQIAHTHRHSSTKYARFGKN